MTCKLYNTRKKEKKKSNTASFIFLAPTIKISIQKPFMNKAVSRIQSPSPQNGQYGRTIESWSMSNQGYIFPWSLSLYDLKDEECCPLPQLR